MRALPKGKLSPPLATRGRLRGEDTVAAAAVSARGGGDGGPASAAEAESADGALRVGAAYNVFDGVELLKASILSVRPVVSFVCVVFQKVSNFGAPIAPEDFKALRDLTASGVIDELVEYMPRTFTGDEKRHLVAPNATPADMGEVILFMRCARAGREQASTDDPTMLLLVEPSAAAGGASPEDIGDHFCNELSKRELGRRRCLASGCHVFMSIDADEFYARAQLAEAARAMWQGGHDVVTCRMRNFMVDPTWELRPHDDTNRVAAVMRCHPHMPFRLCVPTSMLIDPTRRLLRASRVLDLPRSRLEMHHMSLVRRNLRSKFTNVSNRANYPQGVSWLLTSRSPCCGY